MGRWIEGFSRNWGVWSAWTWRRPHPGDAHLRMIRTMGRSVVWITGMTAGAMLAACASSHRGEVASSCGFSPEVMSPEGAPVQGTGVTPAHLGEINVTELNKPVRGFAKAEIIDTR